MSSIVAAAHSREDPLVTLVGLVLLGALIAAAAAAGKLVLRGVWLLCSRARPGLGVLADSPALARVAQPSIEPSVTPGVAAEEVARAMAASCPQPEDLADVLFDPLCPDEVGLDVVAHIAGAGEALHEALRAVDDVLSSLQGEGWILLRELRMAGVRVGRAVIGPGGIVVVTAQAARWTMTDLNIAEGQADELALALGLSAVDVEAVIVLAGSYEEPRRWWSAMGACAWVVGEHQLAWWLRSLPPRLPVDVLDRVAGGIASGASGARAAPVRLTAIGRG